jgi:hypothetical protein
MLTEKELSDKRGVHNTLQMQEAKARNAAKANGSFCWHSNRAKGVEKSVEEKLLHRRATIAHAVAAQVPVVPMKKPNRLRTLFANIFRGGK